MSFSKALEQAVNKVVDKYIEEIAEKYKLDVAELRKDWSKDTVFVPKESSSPGVNYNNLLKPELIEECKKKGLSYKGTKADLIKTLTDSQKETTTPQPAKTKIQSTIVSRLKANVPTVAIRKNTWGNHEDPQTHLVFSRESKKVIGKQNPDGTIAELDKEDINICHKNKYEYVMPENLDKEVTLQDVKIDELEEDDDDEDVLVDDDDDDEDDEELELEEDADEDDIEIDYED